MVSDYTALLSGYRWNGMIGTAGTPVVISYAFLEDGEVPAPDAYDPFGGVTGYQAFTESQKASFRLALDRIETVSGMRFVEVDDPAYASISVMNATGAAQAGWATIGGAWGDYSINGYLVMNDRTGDYAPGTMDFEVMLHELGHAMGLKHPFEGSPTLDPALDTTDHTVMSYTLAGDVKDDFQHLDVDAFRHLYGTVMPADVTWSWSDTDGVFQLIGGTGEDTLIGIDAPSIVHGGTGDDILWGRDAPDTLFGDEGNDTLDGGDGNDLLAGGAGDDSLNGNWGDDVLEGGAGNDILNGYWGTDTASYAQDTAGVSATLSISDDGTPSGTVTGAATGTDTLVNIENLVGGFGNDTLTGNAYPNVLEGGPGDDVLDGGWGSDTASFSGATQAVTVLLTDPAAEPDGIAGGSASGADIGTDTLRNIENVLGGSGNDTITGNDRDNSLEGGPGNDVLDGRDGRDTAVFGSALSPVTIDLASGTASGADTGSDTLTNIENAVGGQAADRILGDATDNLLIGGNGNDLIRGGDGADSLYGDDIPDTELDTLSNGMLPTNTPSPGSGYDTIYGGDGGDRIYGGLLGDRLYGENGNDTILGEDGWDLVDGGDGRDYLDGGAGRDTLSGGSGNDYVLGDTGNDRLDGGDGSDIIRGGPGHDFLAGGDGYDNLQGGDGQDEMHGGLLGDYMRGDAGNDLLYGDDGWDTMFGGAGNDRMWGGLRGDRLDGEDGDDVLYGEAGWDALAGGAGNDILYGGSGRDTLHGDANDDQLYGGAGNDDMWGGSGADVFVFYSGFGTDVIHDFTHGEDRIDLSNVGAIADWNDLAASHLVIGSSGNATIIDGAHSVELSGITSLSQLDASDFLF